RVVEDEAGCRDRGECLHRSCPCRVPHGSELTARTATFLPLSFRLSDCEAQEAREPGTHRRLGEGLECGEPSDDCFCEHGLTPDPVRLRSTSTPRCRAGKYQLPRE